MLRTEAVERGEEGLLFGLCRIWRIAGARAMSRQRSSKKGLAAMDGVGLLGEDDGDG